MKKPLSTRQQHMLEYIICTQIERGYPPSIREIGQAAHIPSTSVVSYNLKQLDARDLISREQNVSRGLTIGWQAIYEQGLLDELALDEDTANIVRAYAVENNGADAGYRQRRTEHKGQRESGSTFVLRVPMLGRIAAGVPIDLPEGAITSSEADDWLELTQGMTEGANYTNGDRLFALRVKGDSMIDSSVMDGDIVVLRQQERAENGEMVAAWLEDQETTTLKHYHLEGDRVRLMPANPSYQPIICDADKVSVQGKVISVIRHIH